MTKCRGKLKSRSDAVSVGAIRTLHRQDSGNLRAGNRRLEPFPKIRQSEVGRLVPLTHRHFPAKPEASEKQPVIYLLIRFAGNPIERIAKALLFTFKPASCGLCRVFGASIEGDGRIGSAFVSSIDECLKEQQAFWRHPYPAADHNTIVS
jgi:hypothetical protein